MKPLVCSTLDSHLNRSNRHVGKVAGVSSWIQLDDRSGSRSELGTRQPVVRAWSFPSSLWLENVLEASL
ncbi:hypothetical protein F2P81_000390 [Scophthalmus maximus]|uniref:Uncharacterized protein n=1 Tax=Scophthalmus maximus TaxID=52904 RepID=A0A6A4TJ15_SCOMX|nr:hypothetical protein F2P81_000390 [Scophthalmus maximus]